MNQFHHLGHFSHLTKAANEPRAAPSPHEGDFCTQNVPQPRRPTASDDAAPRKKPPTGKEPGAWGGRLFGRPSLGDLRLREGDTVVLYTQTSVRPGPETEEIIEF